MSDIDYERLQKYAKAFVQYELETHDVDPRKTLAGTLMRIKDEEGYKKEIYKKIRGDLFTSESYSKVMIQSLPGGNLVNHFQAHKIVTEFQDKGTEEFENALERLFDGNDEKYAFDEIVNVIGARFDVIAFLFFLKDCDRFLPIRSRLFDERLSLLGVKSELSRNCTWEKYNQFNAWIDEIKEYLSANINSDITLLDAHSFVWALPKFDKYLKGQNIKEEPKRQKPDKTSRSYIVFQGSHHRNEYEDGYLFAPLFDERGKTPHHWFKLTELKPGDRVFHYSRGFIRAISTVTSTWAESVRPDNVWNRKGRLVQCEPFVLESPIDISDYTEDIINYRKGKYSAFNNNGNANRGYLFELEPEIASLFEKATLVGFNEEEDEDLISDLRHSSMTEVNESFDYLGGKKKKPEPVFTNGHKAYPRDRQTAINALALAHFKCEVEENHPTFIRKKSDRPYTEPHHLVPMSFSDYFDVSLDREENIVSLCSNCHNEIHYGRDARVLIEKLYSNRKELLESIGVTITLDELLEMYGIY